MKPEPISPIRSVAMGAYPFMFPPSGFFFLLLSALPMRGSH
jgi:hypothetical protein